MTNRVIDLGLIWQIDSMMDRQMNDATDDNTLSARRCLLKHALVSAHPAFGDFVILKCLGIKPVSGMIVF